LEDRCIVSSFADDPGTVLGVFSDAVVVVDERLTITSANVAAANLVRVDSPEDLVGWTGLDWVHEPDRIDATERLAALTLKQDPPPVSLRLVRRDGTIVWVEITGAALPMSLGPTRFVLGLRNVDWRHEADLDAARVVRRSFALVTAALSLQSAPPVELLDRLDEVVANVGLSVGAMVVAVHEVEPDGAAIALRARWLAPLAPAVHDQPRPDVVSLRELPNWVTALNSARRIVEPGADHPSYLAELRHLEPGLESGLSLALAPGERLIGSLTVAMPPDLELSSDERDFLHRSAQIIGVALQRVRSQEALMESEAMFRDLFERSSAMMYLVDPVSLRIVEANQAAARFYGYERGEMAGMDLHHLTIHTRDELVEIVEAVRAGGTTVIDEQQRLKSGEVRTVEIHSTPMRLGHRVLDLAIVQDVTEQRRAVERLERLASTDDLTGALNRRRFLALVAEEIDRSQRYGRALSLLMLDLDHFKAVNDSYGHLAGDAVLVAFTNECITHLRSSDRFARMGGEEFAILMPEADLADAAALGERIRAAVEHLDVPEIGPSPSTVSIGGAEWERGMSVDALFARADRMLYLAKQRGRNRYEG
jgi:diguanylate cyclase (GGDEF)-like protein/PAS domain S-box-containing protein